MSKAAMDTNHFRVLGRKVVQKKRKIPKNVKKAKQRLNKIHRRLKESFSTDLEDQFKESKKIYHEIVRSHNLMADMERDTKLFNIMGENPGKVFRYIKAIKMAGNTMVAKLTVDQEVYTGEAVADGFYEISEKLLDYKTVIELCRDHGDIPTIDYHKAKKLLYRIKRGVRDAFKKKLRR